MANKYQYTQPVRQNLLRRLMLVGLMVSFTVALVAIGGWIVLKHFHKNDINVQGKSVVVSQAATNQNKTTLVQEPTFSFQLPISWREIPPNSSSPIKGITWQPTTKYSNARWLTIYTDTIPTTQAVNLVLPLSVDGNHLIYGTISSNCSDFTPGRSSGISPTAGLEPVPSVWKNVNFLCDLPNPIDDKVGTGSIGGSINSVSVTGPKNGTHNYFFLYTDHTSQPDYSLLYNVIGSFQAL